MNKYKMKTSPNQDGLTTYEQFIATVPSDITEDTKESEKIKEEEKQNDDSKEENKKKEDKHPEEVKKDKDNTIDDGKKDSPSIINKEDIENIDSYYTKLTEENREIIMSIPNFDADKFEEITGIKID